MGDVIILPNRWNASCKCERQMQKDADPLGREVLALWTMSCSTINNVQINMKNHEPLSLGQRDIDSYCRRRRRHRRRHEQKGIVVCFLPYSSG